MAADRPTAAAAGEPLLARETRRLYAADWDSFVHWCQANAVSSLPASADAVAAFLASLADTHRPGSRRRRLAAIAFQHRSAGHAAPDGPTVRASLRAPRCGVRLPDASRATPAQLVRAATRYPGDPSGLRDRALLLLLASSGLGRARVAPAQLYAGANRAAPGGTPTPDNRPAVTLNMAALPRTALLRLEVEGVRFTREGVEITLVDGDGADPATRRRVISLGRQAQFTTCPVHALEDWLRSSDARYGPVFRKVDRWGNVEHRRLHATAPRGILVRRGAVAPGGGRKDGPA